VYFHDIIFKLLRRRFGFAVNKLGNKYNLADKIESIKIEEAKLIKNNEERVSTYLNKKYNKNLKEIVFGAFNPLNDHLYFKIALIYMKVFASKISLKF
jgi:hypothetical protein